MTLTVPVPEIVAESTNPLFRIHASWEKVSLGLVAEVLNGFAFESRYFDKSSGTPLLRIRDVGKDHTDCFYTGAYDDRFIVKAGDLLVGMDGDFKCARWKGPDALLNQRVCRIRVTTEYYDEHFLELALPGYLKAINESTSSMTVRHLSSRSVQEIPLPLPPLGEQKRIVAKVEELLVRVNTTRERLAKVPAILQRFRQAVLAAACSGGLTEDWRKKNGGQESGKALLQRILTEKFVDSRKPMEVQADNDRPELPDTWTWASFGDITSNFDGRRIPVKSDDRKKRRGAYPYYGASGIIDSIDDYLFDGEFLLIAEDGANLEMRSTPIAFGANGKFWVNNHAHVVQTKGDIPLAYVEGYLNGIELQDYITGSAQPKLTQANMNRIPVPLPPLVEEVEIVRRLATLFELGDRIEKRVATATQRTEQLTQGILAKVFRGELVPTEGELARRDGRSYESASELLSRIINVGHESALNASRKSRRHPAQV